MVTGPQTIKYSVRERYLWELFDPASDDPMFTDGPNQVRAEFHDRIIAPLYPLAFVLVTYAFLGAPRTTRQGRTASLLAAIGTVLLIRGLGFVGMIAGLHAPIALALPYLALAAAFVLSYLAISRAIILEPPAFNAVSAAIERLAQRAGAPMRQAS
jgi:lipopolysaccharide export system permease protein